MKQSHRDIVITFEVAIGIIDVLQIIQVEI